MLVTFVQVYMMDKRYLDPRRPLGTPTKDDQAEMLVPYDVELPFAPQFFATHQEQVANLAGELASPASVLACTFQVIRPGRCHPSDLSLS